MSKKFSPSMVLLDAGYEVGTSGGGDLVGPGDPNATYMSPDGLHIIFKDPDLGQWVCIGCGDNETYPSVPDGWIKLE